MQRYLDTDIILALVKDEDWLKEHVDLSKLKPACTSVLTILEARLVLDREYGRDKALNVFDAVKRKGITLIPFEEKILVKSQELLHKHPELNNFDSIHAAFALVHDFVLVGTDNIFAKISGLKHLDPRQIK